MFGVVGQLARIPIPEDVIAAFSAFLCTLAERLSSRDAFELARELPPELATFLLSPPRAHGDVFSAYEFYERMSARQHVSATLAERHARVIGAVVGAQLSASALEGLNAVLPSELRLLFEPLPDASPKPFLEAPEIAKVQAAKGTH